MTNASQNRVDVVLEMDGSVTHVRDLIAPLGEHLHRAISEGFPLILMKPITMVHLNGARIDDGILTVDRKFHVGMLAYAKNILAPIVTLNPEMQDAGPMDLVHIPVSKLPYRVSTFKIDPSRRPLPTELPKLHREISTSQLVYGDGFGAAGIAKAADVPYILMLELDLQTHITVNTAAMVCPLRRKWLAARMAWHYVSRSIQEMREAHSIHCNGYPIFEVAQRHNENTLMYLDSRITEDMMISDHALNARLRNRGQRLRLLFSGRYERMKGADDAIKVAINCIRRGLDIEMHCYGQGPLRSEMQRLAADYQGRIQIHDPVPYPELVKIARTFDLFVCCHIQSDPSCTYLETFGAGLPIVGYANRMWKRLAKESRAGFSSPIGNPNRVADGVQWLMNDRATLNEMSTSALDFAYLHSHENEHGKRIDALNFAITGRVWSNVNIVPQKIAV
jgi:colanic acid/amylovoran biosynthesis glycosyltransferase